MFAEIYLNPWKNFQGEQTTPLNTITERDRSFLSG